MCHKKDTFLVLVCTTNTACILINTSKPTEQHLRSGTSKALSFDFCGDAGVWAGGAPFLWTVTQILCVWLSTAEPAKAFVQMFPLDWVTEAPFTFAHDLVNGPPFTSYRERLDARDGNQLLHVERTTTCAAADPSECWPRRALRCSMEPVSRCGSKQHLGFSASPEYAARH